MLKTVVLMNIFVKNMMHFLGLLNKKVFILYKWLLDAEYKY